MFPTKYNKCHHERFYSSPGNEKELIYGFLDDNPDELTVIGQRDIQTEIDSFAESTDIHVLISRFMNGDPTAMASHPFYGDVSDFPETLAEFYEHANEGKLMFDALPDEIRSKYKNAVEFFDDFGSEHYNSILDEYNASLEPNPIDASVEVKSDAE